MTRDEQAGQTGKTDGDRTGASGGQRELIIGEFGITGTDRCHLATALAPRSPVGHSLIACMSPVCSVISFDSPDLTFYFRHNIKDEQVLYPAI